MTVVPGPPCLAAFCNASLQADFRSGLDRSRVAAEALQVHLIQRLETGAATAGNAPGKAG